MLNAFAVVMFITAVYAILGVTFFRDRRSPASCASPSSGFRGIDAGTGSMKHFGSFTRAFVTVRLMSVAALWAHCTVQGCTVQGPVQRGQGSRSGDWAREQGVGSKVEERQLELRGTVLTL